MFCIPHIMLGSCDNTKHRTMPKIFIVYLLDAVIKKCDSKGTGTWNFLKPPKMELVPGTSSASKKGTSFHLKFLKKELVPAQPC